MAKMPAFMKGGGGKSKGASGMAPAAKPGKAMGGLPAAMGMPSDMAGKGVKRGAKPGKGGKPF